MPNSMMDGLTPDSGDKDVRDAISSEIKQCMGQPAPAGASNQQKYCAGKAYGMARERTGKSLGEGKIQS